MSVRPFTRRSLVLFVAIGYTERVLSVNKPQLRFYRDVRLPIGPPRRFRRPWHR